MTYSASLYFQIILYFRKYIWCVKWLENTNLGLKLFWFHIIAIKDDKKKNEIM